VRSRFLTHPAGLAEVVGSRNTDLVLDRLRIVELLDEPDCEALATVELVDDVQGVWADRTYDPAELPRADDVRSLLPPCPTFGEDEPVQGCCGTTGSPAAAGRRVDRASPGNPSGRGASWPLCGAGGLYGVVVSGASGRTLPGPGVGFSQSRAGSILPTNVWVSPLQTNGTPSRASSWRPSSPPSSQGTGSRVLGERRPRAGPAGPTAGHRGPTVVGGEGVLALSVAAFGPTV
jgi:hypothetical protein